MNVIVDSLRGVPKELIVVMMGILPISELRGAIPLALSFGMSISKAFWLSILGNVIFIAPALFLFEPISRSLRKFKIWSHFFDWVFERTKKNSDVIQRYEALGLAIFVAVPLPMTGAWSGVIAASLCGLGLIGWKELIH